MPHQTQLGCGWLKHAVYKAGTSVMQVESACTGKGAASRRVEARGALDPAGGQSCWQDPASPLPLPCAGLGRAQQQAAGAQRRKEGSKRFLWWGASWHLSSLTSALLALHGPSSGLSRLPGCQPPARRQAPHPLPRLGAGKREMDCEEDQLLPAPNPPQQSSQPPPAPRVKRVFKLVLVSWTPSR